MNLNDILIQTYNMHLFLEASRFTESKVLKEEQEE